MANSTSRILIIGGGFGGLFTALGLTDAGQVTLISKQDHYLHTPMLYEYLSGEVEAWHIAPRYSELLSDDLRFIQGEVTDVDFAAREVGIAGQDERVPYDVLVLAVGGVTNYWNIEGAEQHAMPFRTIEHADALRLRMVRALDRVAPDQAPQDVRRQLTFAVVGGGASGVELATKMADLLNDAFERRALPGEPRVLVMEMSKQVVPGMGDEIRSLVEDALKRSRVEVHTQTRVLRVTQGGVAFEHAGEQTEIEAAAVVWTAGVRVNPLVEKLDLEKEKRGYLVIQPTLQTQTHENVFALGDIAIYTDADPQLAGTAQLAFQESSLAVNNVRAFLQGRELETRHFSEIGEALSLGTENAAVMAEGHTFGGVLARQARFALYTSRLPTWHHRLRVGASWFFGGKAPRPLQPLGLNR
jgi:NADH:ubiquinone reductase (non-electrogenic)